MRVHKFVLCRCHGDGFVSCRTNLCAGAAARAVHEGESKGELVFLCALHRSGVSYALCLSIGKYERSYNAVRTNVGTPVTLHTVLHVPVRKICRDTTLFEGGGTRRHHAVCCGEELGYRNVVCRKVSCRNQNIVEKLGVELVATYQRRRWSIVCYGLPAFRNFNLVNMSNTRVYCGAVHVYDVLAFSAVGLLDGVFHVTNRFVNRNDVCQLEECSLKDGVGSSCAKTDFLCKGNGVAGVELDVVICDVSLNLSRKMLFQFFVVPHAVEQEESARFDVLNHLVLIKVSGVVASNEVSLLYVVG